MKRYWFIIICLSFVSSVLADVKSLSGSIRIDIDMNGVSEAILNEDGFGIGILSSANLHVAGNAKVTDTLSVASSVSSSNLNIGGTIGFSLGLLSGNSNNTIDHHHYITDRNSSDDVYYNLPSVSSHMGQIVNIKNNSSGNYLYLYGPDDLDTFTEIKMEELSSVKIISDGNQWYILSAHGTMTKSNHYFENLTFFIDLDGAVMDQSPFSNDGTLTGNSLSGALVAGALNQGIQFDGVDDMIEVPHSSSYTFGNAGTISFWIKPSSNSTLHGTHSTWQSLTVPDNLGDEDPSEMAFTIVEREFKYVVANHNNGTERVKYGTSDLEFSGLTWTNFSTYPNGVRNNDAASIVIDSDGDRLYFASSMQNSGTTQFYTANSALDYSDFSGWLPREDPTGSGAAEPGFIDMVIVDEMMYFAAYLHNGGTEAVSIGSSNLDSSGNITWDSVAGIGGTSGGGEHSNAAIDSDGTKLYYAFFSTSGTSEALYLASSNLDGSGLVTTAVTEPNGVAANSGSDVELTIAGGKLHYGIVLTGSDNVQAFTAYSDLDGSNLSAWTNRRSIHDSSVGTRATSSIDIITSGTNLTLLSYAGAQSSNANVMISTIELDGAPVISKGDAYSLNYTGGGFVFDWIGSPLSFGNIPTDDYSHVVISYDGNVMIFYIDGVELRRQTVSVDFNSNTESLKLGGDGSRYFDGALDDIRLYDRSLNAEEVNNLFEQR